MGLGVLILGESGTGKSASIRNFSKDEVAIINVAAKPLPFRGSYETFVSDNYREIKNFLKKTTKKTIVIDDAQYLMANEFMRRATEKGFDKFTEIAQNYWDLIQEIRRLPEDMIVYFLTHIERDASGNEKAKTIGKLLDEKITLEGMFTVVLKTNVKDGVYTFSTQNNGYDTVKSPIGLFSTLMIPNDLKLVDTAIRNYYEFEVSEINEQINEPVKESVTVKTIAETLADEVTAPEPQRRVEQTFEEKVENFTTETPTRRSRRKA